MQMIQKDNPKIIKAWTFYDWANSVFPLVITSAIFPNFYDYVTTHDESKNFLGHTVQCFGRNFENQNIDEVTSPKLLTGDAQGNIYIA